MNNLIQTLQLNSIASDLWETARETVEDKILEIMVNCDNWEGFLFESGLDEKTARRDYKEAWDNFIIDTY